MICKIIYSHKNFHNRSMQRMKKSTCTMRPMKSYKDNRTYGLFHTICKIVYTCCATNFWFEDMDYPANFMRIYNAISRVVEVTIATFLMSLVGALWTQPNLTEQQSNDRLLFAISHAIIYSVYRSAVYYKQEIRELVFTLAVKLKEGCNDELIEKMMFRSTIRYLTAFIVLCYFSLFSFGIESGIQALTTNATFTTVIPVWPDVEDRRLIAGAARIVCYIVWWNFVVRVISVYYIILTITNGLAYQFKNLCKYFEDLNNIFEGSGSQEEKERRYEDAFKVGIKMHSITLWCIRQTQVAGGIAFSGQVVMSVWVLVILMIQMKFTERTLIAVMPIAMTALSVLSGSAVFMWNAGDVTIEASRLPTAMFHSGWHRCTRQSSVRVRKMATIAITQAQKRVFIKGFGFIELSYESYVTIVKSSYSLFSVIY